MRTRIYVTLAFILTCSIAAIAQVPGYVPTNGLVGYWPFNGNANDASGNGNHGNVNWAILSSDRFGNSNRAYSFNGINQYISSNCSNLPIGNNPRTVSFWINIGSNPGNSLNHYTGVSWGQLQTSRLNDIYFYSSTNGKANTLRYCGYFNDLDGQVNINNNQWHFVLATYSGDTAKIYFDGILISSGVFPNWNTTFDTLYFGWDKLPEGYLNGKLDDIGIWSRALTQQEITNLYLGCGDSIITNEPTNAFINKGLNAQFTTASATGSSYQWQTNPLNIGWMNVPANSYYNGVNTNCLGVNNVSVSNHNQAFRALVNSNGCADTSKVVYLKVTDTCLTTVTDTLIINTTVGLPTPNVANTLLIYPNPAKDRITIDNGNFSAMNGYSIKIENAMGQQVFSNAINQAQFNIDLSTWTGKGIYYVRLLDTSGNVVTTRKILLH